MNSTTSYQSASAAILYQLSEQGRLVLSDWRAMIFLRRAAFSSKRSRQRWSTLPTEPREAWPILRRMVSRGDLEPILGLRHVYRASVPYARERPVDEREVLMEAHPYASLGYLSALVYHGMTDVLPKVVTAVAPSDGKGGEWPPGTGADDWEGLSLVGGRRVQRLMEWPVRWRSAKSERYFGFALYAGEGFPLRVTTPERTAVDGLRDPGLCGGLDNVLRAWAISRDTLDADLVVNATERLGEVVLRQRVGFVMERLGLEHPALEEWARHGERGGSARLVASESYAATYDERWNLSLNAPTEALDELP